MFSDCFVNLPQGGEHQARLKEIVKIEEKEKKGENLFSVI
jgi:hypothetical protein